MDIILGIIEQGMIYAIITLGIYITYRVLDFPDLTVDGSFTLGAAVTVMLITNTQSSIINILTLGHNPLIICIYAFVSGGVAGFVTGIIHVKLKVRDLLSGIITMTGLYSINLHIAGRANVPIFNMDTIFTNSAVINFPEILQRYRAIVIICILTLGLKAIIDLYLNTKSGYLLRAVGSNHILVKSLGKDSGNIKIIGLSIANGLVALGGSVIMQQQGFFEISMGTGVMVIGLASVIIGTNIFKKLSFIKSTTAVVFGSIIYKACMSIAMDISIGLMGAIIVAILCLVIINKSLVIKTIITMIFSLASYLFVEFFVTYEISASDMKLVTSLLFLIILITGKDKKKKVLEC